MTTNEQKETDYKERLRFWSDKSIEQFGYSINLFLSISIALFSFIVLQKNNYNKLYINLNSDIDWKLTFYIISIVLTLYTIIVGFIAVISRLYDFRLTRQVLWFRKKTIKKHSKTLSDSFIDLRPFNALFTLLKIVFVEEKNKHDIDRMTYEEIQIQFEEIRKNNKLLDNLIWKCHTQQIIGLLFSLILFGISYYLI